MKINTISNYLLVLSVGLVTGCIGGKLIGKNSIECLDGYKGWVVAEMHEDSELILKKGCEYKTVKTSLGEFNIYVNLDTIGKPTLSYSKHIIDDAEEKAAKIVRDAEHEADVIKVETIYKEIYNEK